MLAIRMQRTGRKGHAQFRVIVQEARLNPSSDRVVARLGSYNPHTKEVILDKQKAATFLNNGAQPSNRAALLLKNEGIKLPKWVTLETKKTGTLKHADKLRKNRPAGAPAPAPKTEVADEGEEASVEDKAAEPETQAEEAAPTETETPAAKTEPEATETQSETSAEAVDADDKAADAA